MSVIRGATLTMLCVCASACGLIESEPDPFKLVDVNVSAADASVASAIQAARNRVQQEPRNPELRGNLALTLEMNGFAHAAITTFEQAERLDWENADWPYYQALLHAAQGNYERALAKINRVVRINDQDVTAWLWRAQWLLESNDLSAARRSFERANASGERFHSRIGLIRIALRRDQPANAIALIEEAEDHSQHPYFLQLRSEALRMLGSSVEVEVPAVTNNPLPKWIDRRSTRKLEFELSVASQLADIREQINAERWTEVGPRLESLRVSYPTRQDVIATHLEFLRHTESASKYVRELKQTVDQFPHSVLFGSWLAEELIADEQLDQAQELLDSLVDRELASHDVFNLLGLLAMRRGSITEATEAFAAANALAPKEYESWYYLGIIDAASKNWLAAEEKFDRSVTLNPSFAQGFVDLAKTQVEQGKFVAAATNLREAERVGASASQIASITSWLRSLQSKQ